MAEQIFFSINVDTGKPIKTIGELKANTKALTKELDNTKIGTKRFNQLKKSLTANKEASKNLNREINKTRPLAESIKEGVSGISSQVRIFGVSVGTLATQAKTAAVGMAAFAGGTGKVSKSMKVLRLAIAATGIGLLILALGSLIAFFTQTKRGADLLSQATAGLGVAFDQIIDLLSSLGESLVAAFENPQKALKDFGEAIKQFVINRFLDILSGIKGIGTAVSLVFEGEWKRALSVAKDAAIDLATGFIPIAGLVKDNADAIGEFGDQIAEAASAAVKLKGELNTLADAQNAFIVTRAKLMEQVRQLRLDAKDENRSNAERLQALDAAIAKERELANQSAAIAEEAFRINNSQLKLSENSREDEKKNFELEAAVVNARAAGLKKILTLQSERLGLINKLRKAEQKAEKDRLKGILDENKKELELLKSIRVQANLDAQQDFLNGIITQEEFNQRRLENQREFLEASLIFSEEGSIKRFELQAKLNDIEIAQNKDRLDKLTDDEKAAAEKQKESLELRTELASIASRAIAEILTGQNESTLESLKNFGKAIGFILIDILEKEAIAAIGRGTIKEVAEKGIPAGLITGAILTGVVTGALGVARAGLSRAQDGMILQGNSHGQGGIPIVMRNGGAIEAEGGEAIINKRSTAMFGGLLSAINVSGGGKKFQGGGISGIPNVAIPRQSQTQQLLDGLNNVTIQSQVSVVEINEVMNRVKVIEQSSTL